MVGIADAEHCSAGDDFMRVEEANAVCLCHFCGAWLVFQADRTGETVNCPHCLMGTVLYLPEERAPYGPESFNIGFRKLNWDSSELGYRCIVGEIVNRSPKDLEWLRIQFQLFNGADVAIATASDCIINFAAGATWAFRVRVFDAEVVRASLPLVSSEFGKATPQQLMGCGTTRKGATDGSGLAPEPPARPTGVSSPTDYSRHVGVVYAPGVAAHWSLGAQRQGGSAAGEVGSKQP